MRLLNFALDGSGPFVGMMRFGLNSYGEVEFIAIGVTRDEMSRFQTIGIVPGDKVSSEASINKVVIVDSCFHTADACASGYYTFKTLYNGRVMEGGALRRLACRRYFESNGDIEQFRYWHTTDFTKPILLRCGIRQTEPVATNVGSPVSCHLGTNVFHPFRSKPSIRRSGTIFR